MVLKKANVRNSLIFKTTLYAKTRPEAEECGTQMTNKLKKMRVIYFANTKHKFLVALKRGPCTCSTFKAFNLCS